MGLIYKLITISDSKNLTESPREKFGGIEGYLLHQQNVQLTGPAHSQLPRRKMSLKALKGFLGTFVELMISGQLRREFCPS